MHFSLLPAKAGLLFLAVYWAYLVIPVFELCIRPDEKNLEAAEEELAKHDRVYDYLLYLVAPLLYAALALYLISLKEPQLEIADIIGRTMTMGLLLGAFGINVAHELGHRANKFERFLSRLLLLPSLYLHFIIEHNRGHHKKVGTPDDPATSRENESVFSFYIRTIINSNLNAWRIANDDLRKKERKVFSLRNEMVQYTMMQIAFVAAILLVFGWLITVYYLAAAVSGILLLETVNYIEHYGLKRKEIEPGRYERAMPNHSWNSSHIMGRLMLFELSRHSDHHYMASRKYQILRHYDNSPQLPTGYPGMMMLSLVPPLFFYVMKKQMKKYGVHPELKE